MQKLLLLGDEAIAQAGIDAGISGMYAYPGTPSTEIMEYVQASKIAAERNVFRKWAANEKTALEAGLGMSYAGKRSLVAMKHVGLNVAADPFMNAAITGINGGMVIVVADDPSMHSSQNEQDSRFFGKFALIPVFEPSNQQEAYDMTFAGFDFSEKYKVPVLLRITTRLAHSRSGVECKQPRPQNNLILPEDARQFVLLPSIARVRYKNLVASQKNFEIESENSPYNEYFSGNNKKLGIICCGLAFNYLLENYINEKCPYPILKIAQYPLPVAKIQMIYDECDELLIIEDGYPIVEETIKGILKGGKPVKGRLDGLLPREGELNPDLVAIALGKTVKKGPLAPDIIVNRPPSMCKGCGHIDVYYALNEVVDKYGKGRVFSDIGCYTLGALAPFNSINSCVDMGASVTMAKGAADAGLLPSVCVIGDSTFTHSGMTGLLDAVNDKSPITVIISDNDTTGMTGGQQSSATGRLEKICEGIGVEPEHIRVITPLKSRHEANVKIMHEEFEYQGVSVIIAHRECIQTAKRKRKDN